MGLQRMRWQFSQECSSLRIRPNNVTFIGVLSACAHNGLVDDGQRYWSTMQEMGIKASMENYGCMVDLLCRSGLLDEAYSFVTSMPILPNSVIWRNLLVASKSSNRTDIVGLASKKLFELEPQNPENYVLLSNLYALNSQWDRVRYMRKKMKDNNVTVVAGCSSIEINSYLHKFVVSDGSHPEIKEIRVVLREIADRVLRSGHKPWTAAVLHDVGEEEKEIALCEHSERLAIAYGLLKTKAPHVIRVVKNLRFCPDCHEVSKIISKSYGREIIVRDRVRFHRFIGGSCSCKDFW
ncbi:unnamed protein product [Triticum turgidum subsp. durum]|uniref:DYW domain-containing protein n=1 Tax=Triticum turgidum subsp. durum TaxID=4567 RepID=A0A9R1S5K1_TRITD|nr:unnamed protein product [Triticum turgidum subsp. durum]